MAMGTTYDERVMEMGRLCECGDTRINHADRGEGFCLVRHDTKNRDDCLKFAPTEHARRHLGIFAVRKRRWPRPQPAR